MSDELELKSQERVGQVEPPVVREVGTEVDVVRRDTVVEGTAKPASDHVAARKGVFREYFESGVVTLIMALFGMTYIVQAVKVPTGSMKNTIWVQDHLLVNKYVFGSEQFFDLPLLPSRPVSRGDVAVFKYPEQPETNYVKRVIGLPGETIEFDRRKNRVYINGQELPERRVFVKPPDYDSLSDEYPGDVLETVSEDPAAAGAQWTAYYYDRGDEGDEEDSFHDFDPNAKYGARQPFRIPVKGDPVPDEIRNDPKRREIYDADNDGKYDSDQYFCMGDNRDDSQDSRYWGTVPRSHIVGRAMFVYWSLDRSRESAGKNIFQRSRWGRTGTLIK